jgi:hypothetical protein
MHEGRRVPESPPQVPYHEEMFTIMIPKKASMNTTPSRVQVIPFQVVAMWVPANNEAGHLKNVSK